jgi:hypothetical protein
MADSKTYTVGFNLLDSFSTKYEAIQKKINSITNISHNIMFNMDGGALAKADELGKKVAATTNGVAQAVDKAGAATNAHASAQKTANDALDKGAAAGKQHASVIDTLQNKYEGVTGTFDKFKTVLGGLFTLLASGAMAGLSWGAADQSKSFADQAYKALSSNKRLDVSKIQDFVDSAKDSGYTSSSDRLSLAYTMSKRGARNSDQVKGATEGIEKVFMANRELLEKQYGITSMEDLANIATKDNVENIDKQMLSDVFGKNFAGKSKRGRVKALGKAGKDVDINAIMEGNPLDVIDTRIKSITKSIGGELIGVMKPIAGMFASWLGVLDRNPMLPKIIAIGIGIAAVGGAVATVIGLLPMMVAGIGSVKAGMAMLGNAGSMGKFTSLLMGPWGILIALGALLLIVAYKTGYLQKAWDKFTQSAIGGDIIGGIKGVADWIGTLIDKTQQWYEASGKSQLIGYFETFCSVLGNAWDIIDKIYSTMRSAGASPLLAAFAAIQSIPLAIAGGIFKTATGKDPSEILDVLKGHIQNLLRWVGAKISPTMDKVHEVLKKIQSVFDWLYSLWQGFVSWIKGAMPGAAKETARTAMEKKAEKEGLYLTKEGVWGKTLGEGKQPQKGATTFQYGTPSKRLSELKETYDLLPGFAEGIADAVKKGLEGMATLIAEKISGIFPDFTPLMNAIKPLTDALSALQLAIDKWLGSDSHSGETPAATSPSGKTAYANKAYPGTWDLFDEKDTPFAQAVSEERKNSYMSADVGGSITSSGGLIGHEGEEVLPARVTRGSGPIARALEALYGGAGGARVDNEATYSINVTINSKNDFAGSKLSSDIDLEAMLKKMDARMSVVAVESISRAIGQRRT